MPVDSSGALDHAARISSALKARIAEMMPVVAVAVAAEASALAPTVDEEYNALMAESGGQADVPRAGDRSDDKDNRVRMIKPEETYLQNAIMSPANMEALDYVASVGFVPFLETCTHYRYINEQRIGKDDYEQSPEHEVGPYLDAVLEGGSALIVPVFTLLNGHRYRLRPSDDEKDPGQDSMTKSFSAYPMFSTFNLLARAREILTTALAEMNGT